MSKIEEKYTKHSTVSPESEELDAQFIIFPAIVFGAGLVLVMFTLIFESRKQVLAIIDVLMNNDNFFETYKNMNVKKY